MGRHLHFQPYVIWSAILLGLLGGFGLGAHMVFVLANRYAPGRSFAAMIQVHGHLQLLGWTGLFIIGVSLYKLPRLTSSPLFPGAAQLSCQTVIAGLLLRSAGQLGVFYAPRPEILRLATTLGCILESIGAVIFLGLMFSRVFRYTPQSGAIAAAAIKPFLFVSYAGWLFYAVITFWLGLRYYARSDDFLLDPFWNGIGTETYIHLVLIPTCLAFSISTFPIFLRLRAPTWRVGHAAGVYFAGTAAALGGALLGTAQLAGLGVLCRGAAVLWTIYQLDLVRIYGTRVVGRKVLHRDPPRARAGDYGQFGNFEWLIYAAYLWLVTAVLLDVVSQLATPISPSLIRHFYLLGFVTHLILGMAVRIVPGFLGESGIAFPSLVRVSFALITCALLGRTLPLTIFALDTPWARAAYGFSGVLGILALLALGANLVVTVGRNRRAR